MEKGPWTEARGPPTLGGLEGEEAAKETERARQKFTLHFSDSQVISSMQQWAASTQRGKIEKVQVV